jgi:hypothetical protein
LLDRIVREMDIPITQVVDVIFKAGCSNVSLFIEVASVMNTVYYLGQCEHSYVEFTHWGFVPETASEEQW